MHIKVKKLRLKRIKGASYVVADDGRVLCTRAGETSEVAKVALPKGRERKDYLFLIDKDGDLAREYKDLPRPTGPIWAESHPIKPASGKLGTKQLVAKIQALLYPPEYEVLADAGSVDYRDEIEESRAIYEKELVRLVEQVAVALGPATKYRDRNGYTCYAWRVRDRAIELSCRSEDTEFPASIELTPVDPKTVKWKP